MSVSAILKLQAAGFSVEQVTALADLIDTQAASKSDLEATEHRLDLRFGKVDGEMLLIKWMLGFILAFQVAIFAKMMIH